MHEALRQAIREVPRNRSVIVISRKEPPPSASNSRPPGPCFRRVGSAPAFARRGVCHLRSAQCNGRLAAEALHRGVASRRDHADARAPHEPRQNQRERPMSRRIGVQRLCQSHLDQAPEGTRHVPLSTAFLPRVTPPSQSDAQRASEAGARLEDLYRRRLFTDRRAGEEYVYQFHALFDRFSARPSPQHVAGRSAPAAADRTALTLERAEDYDGALEVGGRARTGPGAPPGPDPANGWLDQGRR